MGASTPPIDASASVTRPFGPAAVSPTAKVAACAAGAPIATQLISVTAAIAATVAASTVAAATVSGVAYTPPLEAWHRAGNALAPVATGASAAATANAAALHICAAERLRARTARTRPSAGDARTRLRRRHVGCEGQHRRGHDRRSESRSTVGGSRGYGTVGGSRGYGTVGGSRGYGIVGGSRGYGTVGGSRGYGAVGGSAGGNGGGGDESGGGGEGSGGSGCACFSEGLKFKCRGPLYLPDSRLLAA